MRAYVWGLFLYIAVGGLIVCPRAYADDSDQDESKLYERRVETRLRVGDDRTVNVTEIWAPFTQDPDRLVYGSLRALADNRDNLEGNLGLGARAFYGDHIWGGYGFIDRRVTSFGSQFWQGTAGVEYMRDAWDARVNIYVPFDNIRTHTVLSDPTPFVVGNGVYVQGNGTVIEEAQTGGDIEVGFKLPDLQDFTANTRLFGAVYHFDGEETPDITGVRARVQADVAPWLQIGARAQYDDERGGQYFAELVFRFPGRAGDDRRSALWNRMADAPERDLDIVTGEDMTPGDQTPLIDAETGAPARFIYVDQTNDTSGTGTAEDPYQDLTQALARAQPYDTVYVVGSTEPTAVYSNGYNMATNHVTLHGSGAPLLLDGNRYSTASLSWAGSFLLRPAEDYAVFQNPNGAGLTVTASDITVRGVAFDGSAASGAVVTGDADNMVFDTVQFTGNGNHGLEIYHTGAQDMNVTVRNSVSTGNTLYGVLADDQGPGTVHVDLGTDAEYGLNDIFGNVTNDMYVNAPMGTITAVGNYFGSGAPNITGPNAGAVYTGVIATTPFCTSCVLSGGTFGSWYDQIDPSTLFETNTVTVSGFTGTRVMMASAMDGLPPPVWIVNGVPQTGTTIQVRSGDTVSLQVSPNPNSYYTRFIQVSGSGFDQFFGVQTR